MRSEQDQLPLSRSRHARRSDGFPVRRWLQLGVASAGMGAALLGFSLAAPDIGVASADSTDDSSMSSETSGASDAENTAPSARKERGPRRLADADSSVNGAGSTGADDADAEASGSRNHRDDEDDSNDIAQEADVDAEVEVDEDAGIDAETPAPQSNSTGAALKPDVTGAATAADPIPAPPWLAPRKTWNEVVAQIMTNWTARHEAWVESLDVSDERKAELDASFLAMRRGLFNQAPTVAPVQLSGLITGPIAGAINGVDADGDTIVYRLVRGPRQGSVVINDDGTYTYTPDGDFDGVDTFLVRAFDAGSHINLLNLLRPAGTRAANLINQGAITFDFAFTGADWTEERQEALREVAASLQEYFRVNKPVTLTFDVNLEDPTNEDRGLASAYSPYTTKLPGYWRTVVQYKLLTGRDANGSKADGEISWNFADFGWGLGDDVGADEYDFVSTAIHELMHSFGFLSSLGAPGENRDNNRGIYDRRLVTSRGLSPFIFTSWPRFSDPKLTGGDGGLYFGGANAVAAYGGLVPIYTPAEFDPGSSLHHLDDLTFTGDDQKIMNAQTGTGLSARVFSAMEIGILKDLGYDVVMPQSPPYGMALIGFLFFVRKRTKSDLAPR